MDAEARARLRRDLSDKLVDALLMTDTGTDPWRVAAADVLARIADEHYGAALDAAEAKLAEVRTIAFDEDVIAALEHGKEATPSVKRLTEREALGYGRDALRDIRTTLDGGP